MLFKFIKKKHLSKFASKQIEKNAVNTLEKLKSVLYVGRSIPEQDSMVYTKHLVCFMDVMNYESSIVSDTNAFKDIGKLITEVSSLLNNLVNHGREVNIIDKKGIATQIQIGAKFCVSDLFNCLVISYDFFERREDLIDIYFALREISIVAIELAQNGFFVQGGIAFGDLFHDERKCVGTAIEKAIRCSCQAIYPRIIFDRDFFGEKVEGSILTDISDIGRNYRRLEEMFHCVDLTTLSKEERTESQRRNPNLVHFLDYLEITLSEHPEIIPQLKKRIMAGLSKTTGDENKRFLWYAEYFNSIVHNTLCYGEDVCINIVK